MPLYSLILTFFVAWSPINEIKIQAHMPLDQCERLLTNLKASPLPHNSSFEIVNGAMFLTLPSGREMSITQDNPSVGVLFECVYSGREI